MNIKRFLLNDLPTWSTFLSLSIIINTAMASPLTNESYQKQEFPLTDFSKRKINISEIRNDGTNRNSIPAIFNPQFMAAKSIKNIGDDEPVISININGDLRAYPLRILLWHEVVNDHVGGRPILITFCSLCDSGIVYDRYLDDKVLKFGNTGRLRHFNNLIFDTETESWWQQFTGMAVIGKYLGKKLIKIPSRRESFLIFKSRTKNSSVMIPTDPKARDYGSTPYIRMDSQNDSAAKFPYKFPIGIKPNERIIVVDGQAWPRDLVTEKKRLKKGDLILSWWPGQNSIYDTHWIPFGKDIGNVQVLKNVNGKWTSTIYDEVFAFTFAAFQPKGMWNLK